MSKKKESIIDINKVRLEGRGINMELAVRSKTERKQTKARIHSIVDAKREIEELDTFDEMIRIGEEFKKALGLSDGDVYKLLKR